MLVTGEEKVTTTPQTTSTEQDTGTVKAATSGSTSTTANASQTSAYNNAMKVLTEAGNATPSFTSSYDSDIANLYDKIINQGKFSYDYSADPVYGQLKESYTQQGKQAMRDTQGQAAALTGGYGSSYGQAVGQQQYDAYLSKLNDAIPELYANAYNYYQGEQSKLNNQLALAQAQRATEYGEFRDALSDSTTAKNEAITRGSLGDWSAYADIYGTEAAKVAAIMSNPQAAWAQGIATANEVKKYTGSYPKGYTSGSSYYPENGQTAWANSWNVKSSRKNSSGVSSSDIAEAKAAYPNLIDSEIVSALTQDYNVQLAEELRQ